MKSEEIILDVKAAFDYAKSQPGCKTLVDEIRRELREVAGIVLA